MKNKFVLLLATSALVLVTATNTFGYSVILEGEENTGESYETVVKSYFDVDEEETEREVVVHLIPREERFKIVDYNFTEKTNIGLYSIVFGNRNMESGMNGSSALLYDCFDYYHLNNDYQEFKKIDYQPVDWLDTGGFFTVDDIGYAEWENIVDIDPEPYFFQFADVPLLKADDSGKIEEPNKPAATDSNATATDSNASHHGSGASSGGSSNKKVVTNSQNVIGTWIQDNIGWWLKKSNGSYPCSEWAMVNDIWYYFDETGYMKTGWLDINGAKYYLNSDGSMVSNNWNLQDGNWYYFDENGVMKTGWIFWKDQWYFLKPDGSMQTNGLTPDGYQVDEHGVWKQ